MSENTVGAPSKSPKRERFDYGKWAANIAGWLMVAAILAACVASVVAFCLWPVETTLMALVTFAFVVVARHPMAALLLVIAAALTRGP